MNTTTHIAGHKVTVNGRVVQRCCICGEKLVDSKNTASPDGGEIGTWELGRFIRESHGNPTHWELLDYTDKWPHDLCLDLVE